VLDISGLLLLITFVIFIIVLLLLNKWLYQPLLKLMDDRKTSIANDMKNAGQSSQMIKDLNSQSIEIIERAKVEASKIREKALISAKKNAEIKILAKKKELEDEYNLFLESLSKERVELKNALLSQMPLFKESLKAKITQM
jgi:F-type H+-transporting ATPase subunit b